LLPVWQWLIRDGAPEPARDFQATLSRTRESGTAPGLEAAIRKFQLAAAEAIIAIATPVPGGDKRSVPSVLIDIAMDWLRREFQPGWELQALLIAATVPVTWENLRSVVGEGLRALRSVSVMATDFTVGGAAIKVGECLGTGVAMSAARAGWTTPEITSQMLQMREELRGHAHQPGLWLASVTALLSPAKRESTRTAVARLVVLSSSVPWSSRAHA